jgi:hypothetical protein
VDKFLSRQVAVLRRLIIDYKNGGLSLNTLVYRIEGINEVVALQRWKDSVFPIVLSLEQINALSLDGKRDLTQAEDISVEDSLAQLETVLERFETELDSPEQ